MRIGMILDKTFPPDPRVENEAIELIKAGHNVYLFCLSYTNETKKETLHQIKIRRYHSNTLEYKLSALAYTFPFYSRLMHQKIAHFLKVNQIEVIHIHDMRIAGAVFLANKRPKLPTVLDLHDNMPEVLKFYPHLQKFPGKQLISLRRWKEKEEAFINQATKVITVSQEFVDDVIERTNIATTKIVLVPNTVRQSFYKDAVINKAISQKYQDNFVLLYLGDTHLRRGLLTAIKAVKKLSVSIKNIKLVIVGSNTTDAVLKAEVKKLGVANFVDFEGWKDVQLFPSYIQASAICISPLHRNKQHDVAYANKLFQYMSFARPLLVSDATAQKKLIQKVEAGLVHKAQDVNDFIEKTLLLYNDEKLRENFGVNGKQFIETEFSWEQTSKNLVHLYDNLTD
ncbi:MAG: glycosyltransferase family 4 protein [Flavobacteriaceae bacterium]|nr:glycosyltransferase family 4 protein [Flavobacteriaceae bacterium]